MARGTCLRRQQHLEAVATRSFPGLRRAACAARRRRAQQGRPRTTERVTAVGMPLRLADGTNASAMRGCAVRTRTAAALARYRRRHTSIDGAARQRRACTACFLPLQAEQRGKCRFHV